MSETVSSQSVSSKVKRSIKWYGRIPATVLLDSKLNAEHIRLFGMLALFPFQGDVSYIGLRLLAELSGCSPATAMRRINKLMECGHVEVAKTRENGKRTFYRLTSPVFGQKQRDGVREFGYGPSGGKRLVSVQKRKTA